MQFELKRISPESIAEALAKVERYRLLNEPNLAWFLVRQYLLAPVCPSFATRQIGPDPRELATCVAVGSSEPRRE